MKIYSSDPLSSTITATSITIRTVIRSHGYPSPVKFTVAPFSTYDVVQCQSKLYYSIGIFPHS